MTCAGTVVAPPCATSAAMVSVTSMSRSVALSRRPSPSARRSTLARIGIVLRFSTTRWTWPSAFNSAARSTVTFITRPVPAWRFRSRPGRTPRPDTAQGGEGRLAKPGGEGKLAPAGLNSARSLLQHALQELDLVRERMVVVELLLDLAHGVEDRGVVPPAEAAADLRQRAQGQHLGEVHRDLPRPDHGGGAPLGEDVGAGDVVARRYELLDVL